jgi:hypothetical protein
MRLKVSLFVPHWRAPHQWRQWQWQLLQQLWWVAVAVAVVVGVVVTVMLMVMVVGGGGGDKIGW